MLKTNIWIVAAALCCVVTTETQAQKVYKEGTAIVLDFGVGTGFPAGAVENSKNTKVVGSPSNSGGPITNNTETGSINDKVYKKLEIAPKDSPSPTTRAADDVGSTMNWLTGYQQCIKKGTGWRLPTQRELMLMWIFKDAFVDLGSDLFEDFYYWAITEKNGTQSWSVTFGHATVGERPKTDPSRVRCVREMD